METKDYFYATGIIATAAIGIWNAVNQHKINKKTAFINTVTSERVKWLDKLRGNISGFCGLTHTWTRSEIQGTPEKIQILKEIDKLRYLIRLQLNPKSDDGKQNFDKQIEDLVAEIPNLTDVRDRDDLEAAIDKLIVASQSLLKEEWEKVKSEAKSGELSDA
ncbi:MAG: hypothetical protein AAB262_13750 [Elusimicrobiota bacterium]